MSNYPTTGVTNPGPHDILCGRGGGTNAHPGNIKFRKLVAAHKLRYLAASKSDKPGVAREVVKEWRNLNPPGRFLAKADGGSNGDQVVWFDVGDKKAREKASQCLRGRNGAANEAVQALVKTVTANGEACPEDYATLMNKAAMVKARNDIALQQQKDMLSQMSEMAEYSGNFGGNKMGDNEPQPYGLSDKMLNEYSNRDNKGGYNDFRGNTSSGNFNNSDNFRQQYNQFQQNSNQNQFCGPVNNMNGNFQSEDDFIEAEIQRMLRQKQAQLKLAQQTLNNAGGMGSSDMDMAGMGGNMGGGNGMSNRGGFGNDSQAYMGEDSIMKEYMRLMQKQHQMNMNNGMGNMGGMGNMTGMSGFGGMNPMSAMSGMGGMGNQMNNMPQSSMNEKEQWLWNMANGRSNNGNMSSMGFNNNNFNNMNNNMMGNMGGMQDGGNFSPNNDAARNYLNRLRGMRNNENMGGNNAMGGDMGRGNQMAGQSGQDQGGPGGNSGGGRGFTIEEYQASLQEYLANDGEDGNEKKGSKGNVFQVPTSLGDKNTAGRGGRDSMQSIGTFGRNTFQSVDSDCNRKSFETTDDMDVRPTFRSVDTLDMMSITNSVNDIMDDDVLRNPEMREKYEKKLAQNSYKEGDTIQIKTMEHGKGDDQPKKVSSGIDPRLIAMSKHKVQTKQEDGPGRTDKRGSMASVDSRMSFGNM